MIAVLFLPLLPLGIIGATSASDIIVPVVVAVVAATGGGLVSAIAARKKDDATAADLVTKAAVAVMERLEGEGVRLASDLIAERNTSQQLRDEVHHLTEENQTLRLRVTRLELLVRQAGLDPDGDLKP